MRQLSYLLLTLFALSACDDGGSSADDDMGGDAFLGGTDIGTDADLPDAIPPDGAVPDGGPAPDATEADAAVADAAESDAAESDAAESDAAAPDAADPDAEPDAEPDVGDPDAGEDCADGDVRACPDGCANARQRCVDNVWAACEYPEETCNGIDDDCDDSTDEDFAELGNPCMAGLGACNVGGVQVCTADGGGTQCDALARPPTPEICDNEDNDCDGSTDEALSQRCYDGAAGTDGVGACSPGTAVCEGGRFGACRGSILPSAESCNAIDDDCDGVLDESMGGGVLMEGCYDGPAGTADQGICVGGIRECVAGGFGPCAGQVTPGVEICDRADNDCNGVTDDSADGCDCAPGEARGCYSGAAGTANVGECVMGRQICDEDGRYGPCVGEQVPRDELCDGADNDCNGEVDDAIVGTGEACRVGVGACAEAGVTVCDADRGRVVCDADSGAANDELCNGLDDDCDGATDEALSLGEPCAVGQGACVAEGRRVCGENDDVVCDAVSGEPRAELCNGVDDDCDGVVDNGLGLGDACTVGVGECERTGALRCGRGGQVICSVSAGAPGEEACDGLDNDCDGSADEDNPGGGGRCDTGEPGLCAAGVRVCRRGDFACSPTVEPVAETCDGVDEDCDGTVDESQRGSPLTEACYDGPRGTAGVGVCQAGTATCEAGEFGRCRGQRQPGDELCDQLDNDCNGVVDDVVGAECICEAGQQQACYTGPRGTEGVGQCRPGIQTCGADGLGFGPCQDEVLPDGEACNGVDNNCNGTVDDVRGAGAACTAGVGACTALGQQVCNPRTGRLTCDAVPLEPQPEVCDGTDNNCNEVIDDVEGLGRRCSSGEGICRALGNMVCGDRAGNLICNARPGPPEDRETCDGEDDDCDGTIDEDVPDQGDCSVGVGACMDAGQFVCLGANGYVCDATPNQPVVETCDRIDNDCDGIIDDNPSDVGQRCSNGVGACRRFGSTVCGRNGLSCNALPGRAGVEVCNDIDDDCDGSTDERLNCEVFRSCAHAMESGFSESGVFVIQTTPRAPAQNVWCDQTTDGGGWTLVGSTARQTLNDQASDYYDDLTTLAPLEPHAGIWGGMRPLGERFDVRFACRAEEDEAGAPMDVDLSFYAVTWYTEFTTGEDADSCFSEQNGEGQDNPTPARRNNLTEQFLRIGNRYNADGYLEGEDSCGDTGDFSVDFDDRGIAGNRSDGTDWGEDRGARKCGAAGLAGGQWFVFVRERPRAAVIGLPARVTDQLRSAGILAERFDYGRGLNLQITNARFDTVVIGRYAQNWENMPQSLMNALHTFGRNGGNIVAEFDGAAIFMRQYANDFAFGEGAPDPLRWFNGRIGAGSNRGANTPLTQQFPNSPVFDGVEDPIRGGAATQTFFTLVDVDPPLVLGMEVLATFPGGNRTFPQASYPAIAHGRYCGGHFIATPFNWSDDPTAAGFGPLIPNLVREAANPPPLNMPDTCIQRELVPGR